MTAAANQTADFLARMTARSRQRLATAQRARPESALRDLCESLPAPPPLRLSAEGFDLIAEVKRRSPAVGRLAGDALSVETQAQAYAAGGAAALSVLTEPDEFAGDLEHLAAVTARIGEIPAMRKDFIVAPYQVLEARAAGAGGVLLVAAILDRAELRDLLQTTLALGLFALVEVFDARDLEACLPAIDAAGKPVSAGQCRMLIGVNCRDLRNLAVDRARFAELAPLLPEHLPKVAESGVGVPADAAAVAALGYRLALVGTALMRSASPELMVRELLQAGRQTCADS